MHLKLEGPLAAEAELPLLGFNDQGRTWWINEVWYVWTGNCWMKALATQDRP